MRNDGGLHHGRNSGCGEKQKDSGYILKIVQGGFVDGLVVRY